MALCYKTVIRAVYELKNYQFDNANTESNKNLLGTPDRLHF